MRDIQKLIDLILSDEKIQNIKEKIYQDVPIIRTAAEMTSSLPSKYREMRSLATSPEAYRHGQEWLFYQQGKLMEDFTDDFAYRGDFIRYYPTYQALSNDQLRGYFSWRTKVRQGQVEPTQLSFVFLYFYELLNQIGVESPLDGFHKIKRMWEEYGAIDPAVNRYVPRWLHDYVIYYQLDSSLLDGWNDAEFDRALLTLVKCDASSAEEIFGALETLSSYPPERSRFFREYPEDARNVCCGVFFRLSEYYRKHRKYTLCEKLFGKFESAPYQMFASTVFYDRLRDEKQEYVFHEACRFYRQNGRWYCERFYGNRDKSRELGSILREIDCRMRQQYQYPHPLQSQKVTKLVQGIIDREIARVLAEKEKNARPKITIDLSKLSGIRDSAAITRERLLTEEEREEIQEPEPLEPAAEVSSACGLTEVECQLLKALWNGEDYRPVVRESGTMLSVLVDSINEKLYDQFGDTMILFDGEEPELIEDYIEELKGIVP
ncbi:MAG: TerB N-terminal domain-containing protein [Candidatus Merdivicinus sp.]